jgi:hypothetical protein
MKFLIVILMIRFVFAWLEERDKSNNKIGNDAQQDVQHPAANQMR